MLYAEKAYKVALKAHNGQVDKAGKPYILHPCAVASMGSTDYEKAVGYLHDVIEDTEISIEDLKNCFPTEITEAIEAITKRSGEKYQQYLHRVANNPIALKVKINDMTHNSDISRFKNPSSRDIERCSKYNECIEQIKKIVI